MRYEAQACNVQPKQSCILAKLVGVDRVAAADTASV
jgi:hypothetical protein